MIEQYKCCILTEEQKYTLISTISILYITILGPFCTILPLPFILYAKSPEFISLIVVEAVLVLECTVIYYVTKHNNKGFKEKEFMEEYHKKELTPCNKRTNNTISTGLLTNKEAMSDEETIIPSIISNVEVATILQNYCYICSQHVTERTEHCLICDECIDAFDHHCVYLGCCVGYSNKRYFYGFLGTVLVLSLYEFIVAITEIVYVALLYNNSNIGNNFLEYHKELWILAPSIINMLMNAFPLYFTIYLSCYHCGLYKHKMTTYEFIQNVNDRYEDKKITRKEAYALKKCPCVNLKCALCLTLPTYRHKEEDEFSSSSSDEITVYNKAEDNNDEAEYETVKEPMEQSVPVEMELETGLKKYTVQNTINKSPYRIISSALGAVFPLSTEPSERCPSKTENLRAKSQMTVHAGLKGMLNEEEAKSPKQGIESINYKLNESRITLKPLRGIQNYLEESKQPNEDEEEVKNSVYTDISPLGNPLQPKRYKKKKKEQI